MATLLTGVISLLVNGIWVRYLPQDTYGNFRLVLNMCSIAATFCFLGAGQAAIMSSAQRYDGNFIVLIKEKIKSNLKGTLFLTLAFIYFSFFQSESLSVANSLLICALIFPVFNISDIWSSWLNGKSKFLELSIYRIISALVPLIAIFISITLNNSSLLAIVCLLTLLTSIQNTCILKIIKKSTIDEKKNIEIVKFGKKTNIPLFFGNLLGLDLIMINYYFTESKVAVYAVALLLPEYLKSIFSLFSQFFAPKINSAQNIKIFWQGFKKNFILVNSIFIFLGILGFCALPTMYNFFFGINYDESGRSAKWLWLTYGLFGSITYLGLALIAQQNMLVVRGAFIGYPLVQLLLYFLFLQKGPQGLILAKIIGIVVLALFYVFSFVICLKREPKTAGI